MPKDARQYLRLDSYFPVDFTVVQRPEGVLGLDWQSGATRNVSIDGICLETQHLTPAIIKHIIKENVQLELRIQLVPAIRAVADVVWYKKEDDVYLVGLKFLTIKKEDLQRLTGHAHWFDRLSLLAWVLAFAIVVFVISIRVLTLMK
jgi:hypothetical protein